MEDHSDEEDAATKGIADEDQFWLPSRLEHVIQRGRYIIPAHLVRPKYKTWFLQHCVIASDNQWDIQRNVLQENDDTYNSIWRDMLPMMNGEEWETTYEKSQYCELSGSSQMCSLEYRLPLELPIQTS